MGLFNHGCSTGGIFGGNSEILFFIIIFLLLFFNGNSFGISGDCKE